MAEQTALKTRIGQRDAESARCCASGLQAQLGDSLHSCGRGIKTGPAVNVAIIWADHRREPAIWAIAGYLAEECVAPIGAKGSRIMAPFNEGTSRRRASSRLRRATVSAITALTALLAFQDRGDAAVSNVTQASPSQSAQTPQAEPPAATPQANPPPQTPSSSGPAAAPPSPVEEKKNEVTGTPATVIDGQQLESILGKSVLSPTGEDMGRIVDIMVDHAGQVRAAIVDFGGFLGVGSRKIAVDWRMLHFPSDGKDNVTVDLSRDQLRVAPIVKAGEPIVVLGGPKTTQ
jgi:PRC-barrel domain